jgi:hypothetical protein
MDDMVSILRACKRLKRDKMSSEQRAAKRHWSLVIGNGGFNR